jgi:hypothetical protein
MSLIIDCSNCVAGTAPRNREERTQLWELGLRAPLVKLDTITAENATEWQFRLRFLDQLFPGMLVVPPPLAAIERWIGLRVNVERVRQPEWVEGVAEHAAIELLMTLAHEQHFN